MREHIHTIMKNTHTRVEVVGKACTAHNARHNL